MEHAREGYRSVKIKSYLVFYRLYDEKNMKVIRILHQSMDVDNSIVLPKFKTTD